MTFQGKTKRFKQCASNLTFLTANQFCIQTVEEFQSTIPGDAVKGGFDSRREYHLVPLAEWRFLTKPLFPRPLHKQDVWKGRIRLCWQGLQMLVSRLAGSFWPGRLRWNDHQNRPVFPSFMHLSSRLNAFLSLRHVPTPKPVPDKSSECRQTPLHPKAKVAEWDDTHWGFSVFHRGPTVPPFLPAPSSHKWQHVLCLLFAVCVDWGDHAKQCPYWAHQGFCSGTWGVSKEKQPQRHISFLHAAGRHWSGMISLLGSRWGEVGEATLLANLAGRNLWTEQKECFMLIRPTRNPAISKCFGELRLNQREGGRSCVQCHIRFAFQYGGRGLFVRLLKRGVAHPSEDRNLTSPCYTSLSSKNTLTFIEKKRTHVLFFSFVLQTWMNRYCCKSCSGKFCVSLVRPQAFITDVLVRLRSPSILDFTILPCNYACIVVVHLCIGFSVFQWHLTTRRGDLDTGACILFLHWISGVEVKTKIDLCSMSPHVHHAIPISHRVYQRMRHEVHGGTMGAFTLGDARSCFGATSKIQPLDSTSHFDADVKKNLCTSPMWNPLKNTVCQCTDLPGVVGVESHLWSQFMCKVLAHGHEHNNAKHDPQMVRCDLGVRVLWCLWCLKPRRTLHPCIGLIEVVLCTPSSVLSPLFLSFAHTDPKAACGDYDETKCKSHIKLGCDRTFRVSALSQIRRWKTVFFLFFDRKSTPFLWRFSWHFLKCFFLKRFYHTLVGLFHFSNC